MLACRMLRSWRCAAWWAASFLLFWARGAHAVQVGEPLAAALEELRASGLQLIFSSALIQPSFTVLADPGSGTPQEIAQRILSPYGLELDAVRPGIFAIVRRKAAGAVAVPAQRAADAR